MHLLAADKGDKNMPTKTYRNAESVYLKPDVAHFADQGFHFTLSSVDPKHGVHEPKRPIGKDWQLESNKPSKTKILDWLSSPEFREGKRTLGIVPRNCGGKNTRLLVMDIDTPVAEETLVPWMGQVFGEDLGKVLVERSRKENHWHIKIPVRPEHVGDGEVDRDWRIGELGGQFRYKGNLVLWGDSLAGLRRRFGNSSWDPIKPATVGKLLGQGGGTVGPGDVGSKVPVDEWVARDLKWHKELGFAYILDLPEQRGPDEWVPGRWPWVRSNFCSMFRRSYPEMAARIYRFAVEVLGKDESAMRALWDACWAVNEKWKEDDKQDATALTAAILGLTAENVEKTEYDGDIPSPKELLSGGGSKKDKKAKAKANRQEMKMPSKVILKETDYSEPRRFIWCVLQEGWEICINDLAHGIFWKHKEFTKGAWESIDKENGAMLIEVTNNIQEKYEYIASQEQDGDELLVETKPIKASKDKAWEFCTWWGNKWRVNPFLDWYDGIKQKGGRRKLLRFWHTYFQQPRNKLEEEAAIRLWCLPLYRGKNPGANNRYSIALIGEADQGKTCLLENMMPPEIAKDLFLGNVDFGQHDESEIMYAQEGKVLVELAELPGGRKNSQRLKSFLSRSADTYRRKYGRASVTVPRCSAHVITINPADAPFANDKALLDRIVPVKVKKGKRFADADPGAQRRYIEEVRGEMWAAAKNLVEKGWSPEFANKKKLDKLRGLNVEDAVYDPDQHIKDMIKDRLNDGAFFKGWILVKDFLVMTGQEKANMDLPFNDRITERKLLAWLERNSSLYVKKYAAFIGNNKQVKGSNNSAERQWALRHAYWNKGAKEKPKGKGKRYGKGFTLLGTWQEVSDALDKG